jgi:hypothetical protein
MHWIRQNEANAKRFREEMEERLKQFHLDIAPEKIKRLACGMFAHSKAKARGERAGTFDFLGFTPETSPFCSRTRNGNKFRMKRKTHLPRFFGKLI